MYFLKRWYDQDQRVSLAMGCLEKASPAARKKVARLIIQKAKSHRVVAREPQSYFFRRWYDQDRLLSLAIEYFRQSPPDVQNKIADMVLINLTGNCAVG
jgi:hypothetical protein